MPPIFLRKYARSSALAKPASCDVLCSRTSTTFFTPAFKSRSKNPAAVVLVNPIVETVGFATIVTPPRSGRRDQAVVQQKQPSAPVRDTPLPIFPSAKQRNPRCCCPRVLRACPQFQNG